MCKNTGRDREAVAGATGREERSSCAWGGWGLRHPQNLNIWGPRLGPPFLQQAAPLLPFTGISGEKGAPEEAGGAWVGREGARERGRWGKEVFEEGSTWVGGEPRGEWEARGGRSRGERRGYGRGAGGGRGG